MKKMFNWVDLKVVKTPAEKNITIEVDANILDLPLTEGIKIFTELANEKIKEIDADKNYYIDVIVSNGSSDDLEIIYELFSSIFTQIFVDFEKERARDKRLGVYELFNKVKLKNSYALAWLNCENKCGAFGFEVKKKGGVVRKRMVK